MSKLEASIICVDYADYLCHTLPRNKDYFDKIVVVTVDRDSETKKVCDDNGVEFVVTERLYENGDAFNKGKGLNDGFNKLSKTDWLMTFDSDIILPKNFRNAIAFEHLNKEFLYGTKRSKIRYYEDYMDWSKGKKIKTSENDPCYASGFFQLFNINTSRINDQMKIYPENVGTALSDIMFRSKWAEKWGDMSNQMVCLEPLIGKVIHLPHSQHSLGKDVKCLRNWKGRKTLPFHMQTRKSKKDVQVDDIEELFEGD